jgi:hypothetical protein
MVDCIHLVQSMIQCLALFSIKRRDFWLTEIMLASTKMILINGDSYVKNTQS